MGGVSVTLGGVGWCWVMLGGGGIVEPYCVLVGPTVPNNTAIHPRGQRQAGMQACKAYLHTGMTHGRDLPLLFAVCGRGIRN